MAYVRVIQKSALVYVTFLFASTVCYAGEQWVIVETSETTDGFLPGVHVWFTFNIEHPGAFVRRVMVGVESELDYNEGVDVYQVYGGDVWNPGVGDHVATPPFFFHNNTSTTPYWYEVPVGHEVLAPDFIRRTTVTVVAFYDTPAKRVRFIAMLLETPDNEAASYWVSAPSPESIEDYEPPEFGTGLESWLGEHELEWEGSNSAQQLTSFYIPIPYNSTEIISFDAFLFENVAPPGGGVGNAWFYLLRNARDFVRIAVLAGLGLYTVKIVVRTFRQW